MTQQFINPVGPKVRKASTITGKTLVFRNACVADAAFIYKLRTDARKNKHLSPVSSELQQQELWLKQYAASDNQAYFIIEHQEAPIGTMRIYDAQGESVCFGSWILTDESPSHAGIESALMVYAYAIDCLNFRAAHFEVRKENKAVWRFHEKFGALKTGETADNFLYRIDYEAIMRSRLRYKRYLDGSVSVVY